MFFKKKKKNEESVEPIAKRGVKKIDALVTGAILSGIVASIYGVKKLKEKHHEESTDTTDDHSHNSHHH